jgi:hypothetical protein
VPELELDDVVEPTVVFPDGPVAVAPLTSRTTLFATSQHCFSWPVEPPVEVPCALANAPTANNAPLIATPR